MLIGCANNEEVDALAKVTTSPCPKEGKWIQVKILATTTIENTTLGLISREEDDWRASIKQYIEEAIKPLDPIEEEKV